MTPKSLMPIKASALDPEEEAAFWAGKKAWRLLAIPFGGPIPSVKSSLGVDFDGEWFSDRTDIYGGIRALRDSKERLVDWHHALTYDDPAVPAHIAVKMKGQIIGKAILDDEPDEDGWWVDFWFKQGEKRVNAIRRLAERGAQLFGSSQAIPGTVKRNFSTGHIDVWPFALETISSSPQNTYSVLRPAKAMLDEVDAAGIRLEQSTRDWLAELDQAVKADLTPTSDAGEAAAMAGLKELHSEFESILRELRG